MTAQYRLGDLVARFGGHLEGGQAASSDPDPHATAGPGARRGAAVAPADLLVTGFGTLEDAGAAQLAFLANPRYRSQVAQTRAGVVLLRQSDVDQIAAAGVTPPCVLWVCEQPYVLFARISQWLVAQANPAPPAAIAASAVVEEGAVIDPTATIGPGCIVESGARVGARAWLGAGCIIGAGATIGADTRLHARVTVYHDCHVGARGIVHAGAVIGADGFGFARDGAAWVKIPQTGRVLIGDDVEIGANTTIDRGAMADTVLGQGVKLDNQIQIGHNVRIGDHCAMAACVGIAGSATIGARCTVGGGAIILGHLVLADDVHVSAATVVTHSLHQPGQYSGFYPVGTNREWERSAAALRRLPDLRERVRQLERVVAHGRGPDVTPGSQPDRGAPWPTPEAAVTPGPKT